MMTCTGKKFSPTEAEELSKHTSMSASQIFTWSNIRPREIKRQSNPNYKPRSTLGDGAIAAMWQAYIENDRWQVSKVSDVTDRWQETSGPGSEAKDCAGPRSATQTSCQLVRPFSSYESSTKLPRKDATRNRRIEKVWNFREKAEKRGQKNETDGKTWERGNCDASKFEAWRTSGTSLCAKIRGK